MIPSALHGAMSGFVCTIRVWQRQGSRLDNMIMSGEGRHWEDRSVLMIELVARSKSSCTQADSGCVHTINTAGGGGSLATLPSLYWGPGDNFFYHRTFIRDTVLSIIVFCSEFCVEIYILKHFRFKWFDCCTLFWKKHLFNNMTAGGHSLIWS